MASLNVYLPKPTIEFLCKKIPGLTEDAKSVSQEDLDNIEEINIRDVDVMYLQYFRNIKTLVIDGSPDIDCRMLNSVIRNCKKVESLIIKNQPKLTEIDISGFNCLKNLSIISNENLSTIIGLYGKDSTIESLDTLEFYDNVNYKDEKELISFISSHSKIKNFKLDALYYIDFVEQNGDKNIEENYKWHEKIGFKVQKNYSYSNGEMDIAYQYAKAIVSNIIKPGDSDEMKISVLYAWITKNVDLEDNRNSEINEGIINVFKYRVASPPTVAKYFQFLLRVAGINSYDIYVLPRVRFNNSIYGTFKIPSDDYEIIMIPTGDGQKFFDLVWDMDIYNKTNSVSSLFMYNGLNDIAYNHRLIYTSNLEESETYPIKDREKMMAKALKRLQNVKSQKINQVISNQEDIYTDIINSHTYLKSKMGNYVEKVSKLLDKKEKIEDKMVHSGNEEKKKYVEKIRNLDLMIKAAEQSNNILRKSVFKIEESVLHHLLGEELSEIECRLGQNVSPFKYIDDEKEVKSKEELNEELNRLHNILNREVTNRMITLSEYRIIKEQVDRVYTLLIAFAFEKSIIVDSLDDSNNRIKKVV